MDAKQAFSRFVSTALKPARAARYCGLAGGAKGQIKLLASLDHDFEKAMRNDAKRGSVNRAVRCYAYHRSVGFGAEFESVAEAYKQLGSTDGWLIVVSDGTAGIYRPEANWDGEIEITG